MMKYARTLCLLVSCLVFDAIEVAAQNSIVLRQQGTNEDEVELKIGDEITIDIFADLGTVGASGISVFVTLPKDVFHIIDQRTENEAATQPFVPGLLFAEAAESRNLVVSPDDALNISDDLSLLEYVVVIGAGSDRSRTGSGVVASFQLQAIQATQSSQISILATPVHETRITLPEGGERQFRSSPQGMTISVQLRLVNEHFRFENAGQLLDSLSVTMLRLQSSISQGP